MNQMVGFYLHCQIYVQKIGRRFPMDNVFRFLGKFRSGFILQNNFSVDFLGIPSHWPRHTPTWQPRQGLMPRRAQINAPAPQGSTLGGRSRREYHAK